MEVGKVCDFEFAISSIVLIASSQDHAGEKWTDVLGWHSGEIEIGEDGWAEFKCPGESVSIWVNKDAEGRDEFGKKFGRFDGQSE